MTPRALTADQIRTAAQIAAQEGVTIEIRSGELHLPSPPTAKPESLTPKPRAGYHHIAQDHFSPRMMLTGWLCGR